MADRQIKISCTGSRLESWRKLKDFQGDLKELTRDSYEKLKNSIKRHGFAAPVFVWKGRDYILDGHQRIRALDGLEAEGYGVPDMIPIVEIDARDEKEAKQLVLDYNSQYGHITEEGLYEFAHDLDWDELKTEIDLPSVNLEEFEIGWLQDGKIDNKEIEYQQKYEVVCECSDEEDQRKVYDLLTTEGYKCRILNL